MASHDIPWIPSAHLGSHAFLKQGIPTLHISQSKSTMDHNNTFRPCSVSSGVNPHWWFIRILELEPKKSGTFHGPSVKSEGSVFPHLPREGRSILSELFSSSSSSPPPLLVFLTTALQLPAPDRSGHCWTSTASAKSQWVSLRALPDLTSKCQFTMGTTGPQQQVPDCSDLNHQPPIAMGPAGPQLQAPDRSGHKRISTASSRSQWALPSLNKGKCQRKTSSLSHGWCRGKLGRGYCKQRRPLVTEVPKNDLIKKLPLDDL